MANAGDTHSLAWIPPSTKMTGLFLFATLTPIRISFIARPWYEVPIVSTWAMFGFADAVESKKEWISDNLLYWSDIALVEFLKELLWAIRSTAKTLSEISHILDVIEFEKSYFRNTSKLILLYIFDHSLLLETLLEKVYFEGMLKMWRNHNIDGLIESTGRFPEVELNFFPKIS